MRKSISDRIWKGLEAAVRAAKHSAAGAPADKSEREFIEAVLYLNRTGCPWRDLPSELGYWHAIYIRFHRIATRYDKLRCIYLRSSLSRLSLTHRQEFVNRA